MKNPRINKKTILHVSVVVVAAIVILIFLSTVVLPPIITYKDFTKILGFEPPGEELEFQVLDRYTRTGKSKYPDYAAKYVLGVERLPEVEELIQSILILDDDDDEEWIVYRGGALLHGTEIKDLDFTHVSPNNPISPRFYEDPYPSPWWDFDHDDILRYYSGSIDDYSLINYILLVSGGDEYIYMYIYIEH